MNRRYRCEDAAGQSVGAHARRASFRRSRRYHLGVDSAGEIRPQTARAGVLAARQPAGARRRDHGPHRRRPSAAVTVALIENAVDPGELIGERSRGDRAKSCRRNRDRADPADRSRHLRANPRTGRVVLEFGGRIAGGGWCSSWTSRRVGKPQPPARVCAAVSVARRPPQSRTWQILSARPRPSASRTSAAKSTGRSCSPQASDSRTRCILHLTRRAARPTSTS